MGRKTQTGLLLFFNFFIFSSFSSFSQVYTFYSKAPGNWTSLATWSTGSCTGAVAMRLPAFGDTVVICSGRTVIFNSTSDVTIANLSIQSTGKLTMSTASNLILNSLVLDGTVDGSNAGDLRMGNIAGSTLSGSGYFSIDNGNSMLRLLNDVTIKAGTDLKFDDKAIFSLNTKTATNYGKISILDPSNFSGNGTFVNAAAASYLLYSRLGNFPKKLTLTATAPGNTVEFGATSAKENMDQQSSYYHLVISGGGNKRFPVTTTTIAGNLTINNNGLLTAYRKVNTATAINIAGNWVNNLGGSFVESLSTVTFNGTTNNQTISPPTIGGETFYNLNINNTNTNGSVTANGAIYITANKTLTMTAGIFNMGTNTLSQPSGSANFTASGGDLRLAKVSTIIVLPELSGMYNVTGGTITFNGAGAQTIKSLNAAPANYHHIALGGSGTKTLDNSITVRGDWTNAGVTLAGSFDVSFAGTGTQNITRPSTETFYGLTTNTTGPLKLNGGNVTVTSLLTMTKGNINLNGQTLLLSAGPTVLSRTLGICYGGTFSQYFPAGTPISSSASPYHGLFPVGTPTNYRPVTINSTVNAMTAGIVSVIHNDAATTTDVSYTDAEGSPIQRITDMNSVISTSVLDGGAYTLGVTMTSLSSTGVLTDLKLETLAGTPAVGTTLTTTGSVGSPTVTRSDLTTIMLNNTFVVGTKDKSATPMVASYYSRKTGSWSDNSPNSTWSTTDNGPSCGCTPTASSRVYINSTHTVTVDVAAAADFLTIRGGGTLTGTKALTIAYDLLTVGTGNFTPTTGAWTIGRAATIAGTSTSVSGGVFTVNGDLDIDAGNSLTLTGGSTVTGDLEVDGTLALGTAALGLSGTNATISGTSGAAAITGTGTITVTNAKTIASSATLSIQPTIALAANTTVTNQGKVTNTSNLTGANSTTSIWINGANSEFNTTGAILTTGVLNTAAIPNLVNYKGVGAQAIKIPSGASYYDLKIANAGTKVLVGNTSIVNSLTIQDAAVLNAGTFNLDGAGDLIMTSTSGLIIGNASSGTYPQLTGSYDLSGGTVTMNPVSANYDIREVSYYNLILSASGTSTMDFNVDAEIDNNLTATLSGTAQIRNIKGDLPIGNVFTFNSTSTTASTISNNVSAGSFILTNGKLLFGGYLFEVTGAAGWTWNGGTYTQDASGKVLFSGDADQVIGGSLSTSLINVEISNSGATGVKLNKSMTVTGVLTLTEGNLVTSSSNFLKMTTTSSVSGVSNDSYVDGPMEKDVDGSAAKKFTFPVGKDDAYRPIGVSAVSTTGTFRAEYFHTSPKPLYDVTLKDATLNHIGLGEYWILNRVSGTPNAVVTLSWDTYSGVVDVMNDLRVARWDGALWKDHGNKTASLTGNTSAGTLTTPALVTSFSPFTIASGTPNNPLPVELISFTAQLVNNVVELKWRTASEKNNDYFTLDKTKNASTFTPVGRAQGAGTSMLSNTYSATDIHPYAGTSYYRLSQTDYDGEIKHFGLVAIYNDGSESIKVVNAFPNPVTGDVLNIALTGFGAAESVTIEFRDIRGVLMMSATGAADDSGAFVQQLNTNQLSEGIYLLHVGTARIDENMKIVVK